MAIDDVEESVFLVKISNSEKKSRKFTVSNDVNSLIDYLTFFRKHLASRPKLASTLRRLFLRYKKNSWLKSHPCLFLSFRHECHGKNSCTISEQIADTVFVALLPLFKLIV